MTSGNFSIKADFLEHQGRKLFYLLLQPTGKEATRSVLYLPPFTEEMHKSRNIVASQARAMAAQGYTVLLLDLMGCGDSGGEFADATWQAWLEDANFAASTLAGLAPGPLSVWGLRMGALLACELSRLREDVEKLILWQPALNGEQQIDQFLRLQTVSVGGSGHGGFDRASLWSELRSGGSLEIAGYQLPSELALEMARERLVDLLPGCPVSWLEVGIRQAQDPSIPSQNVIRNWQEQGVTVDVSVIAGAPFWRNAESGINSDLQLATLEMLSR